MTIERIIESLDTLPLAELADPSAIFNCPHAPEYARFFRMLQAIMQRSVNPQIADNAEHRLEVARRLFAPFITPIRVAKLRYIAEQFQTGNAGYVIFPNSAPINCVLDFWGAGQEALGHPPLKAFANRVQKVIEYLDENLRNDRELDKNDRELDKIVPFLNTYKMDAEQNVQHLQGLPLIQKLTVVQDHIDRCLLDTMERFKRRAPTEQRILVRIVDAARRLLFEYIPEFFCKLAGIQPKKPLFEHRFEERRYGFFGPHDRKFTDQWMPQLDKVATARHRMVRPVDEEIRSDAERESPVVSPNSSAVF